MTRKAPYLDKFYPDVYKALTDVSRKLNMLYPDVELPKSLIELVAVRVSQINGCGTCLSIHVPAARKAGVPDNKLDALPACQIFAEEQVAALEWSIIMINAFNRVSIASGHPLLSR